MVPIKRLVEVFAAGCPLYDDETGICTFTPVLIVTLGIIGLGAVTGYRGVLFPGWAMLLSLALYRLFREI
jgi:hypothetical protein